MYGRKNYEESERNDGSESDKKLEEKELNIRYASEDPSLHNQTKTLESDIGKGKR